MNKIALNLFSILGGGGHFGWLHERKIMGKSGMTK